MSGWSELLAIDTTLTACINSLAGHVAALDLGVTSLSAIGPYLMVGLVVLRWWAKAERSAQRHVAIRCGLATMLGIGVNQLILLFVHRTRPYDLGITRLITEKSIDPSFPSDHATVVCAIAASLLMRGDRWSPLFVALALLTSLSRVYVGTHFVSDIVGGALIGVGAAGVVAYFYRESYGLFQRLVRIA